MKNIPVPKEVSEYMSKIAKKEVTDNPRPREFFVKMGNKGGWPKGKPRKIKGSQLSTDAPLQ